MAKALRHGLLSVCGLMTLALTGNAQTVTVPSKLVQYPDQIIYNAKIVTMDNLDPMGPPGNIYQAMAIRGDLIQFLGTNDEMLALAGPQTQKLDMKGRTVVPGLIDTHNHLHNGFVSRWANEHPQELISIMREFTVSGKSYEELTKGIELVVKEQMAGAPPKQWAYIGFDTPGGDQGLSLGVMYLRSGQMTREKLDEWAPTQPVFIEDSSNYLMNTAARNDFMEMMSVEATDHNEKAALTNPRVDRTLVAEKYFRTRVPLLADIIENGLKHFAAMGFTGYSSHIVGLPIHDAFMLLSREERMPVRFGFAHRACQNVVVDIPTCFSRLGDMAGMGNKYFWNVGVTLGALDLDVPVACTSMQAVDPRIKAMEQCWAEPGGPYYDAIYTAVKSRLRYVINHNNGDKGLTQFMDILDRVMKEDPSMDINYMRSRRFTSDHCPYYPTQEQMPRIKNFNMQFSCGAAELSSEHGYSIGKIYSESYANRVGPIASLFKHGIMASNEGGGDGMDEVNRTTFARWFPYITRKRSDGVVLAPEEAINRVQLLKMSTSMAAYYVLKEKELGTLEPGKFADFVVFNKDYFTVPEEEIPSVYPVMVVMGGKTRVLREEYAKEIGLQPVGPQLKFSWEPLKPREGYADFNPLDYLKVERRMD
ncbi:MAG TPA: amidohydrolase family protein [Terriglobia bacterium]|nr:amidohydrolase family protein [Terriglobia bacterium]